MTRHAVTNTVIASASPRTRVGTLWFMDRALTVHEDRAWVLKALRDRCMAMVLLIPALPLIAVMIVLVRITSRGPGLYKQTRIGHQGRHFTLYKIRTMRVDAERDTGPMWSLPNDPRVTRLGHFLRVTHLDELPQLFNVVAGQMNLVGPRPERPEFVLRLAKQIPGYEQRLAVKPGVTGLAQITFGADIDLDSVRRKLLLDMVYMRTMGMSLDFQITACTALRFFGAPYGLARRMTHLEKITALDYEQLLPSMCFAQHDEDWWWEGEPCRKPR